MELSAIFHDANKCYCYALKEHTFLLRIQTQNFAFRNVVEKEWNSPYIDWYHMSEFPICRGRGEKPIYKCFGYYGGMPKLNLENPETEEYFIQVALYWLKEFHIDGWRLYLMVWQANMQCWCWYHKWRYECTEECK